MPEKDFLTILRKMWLRVRLHTCKYHSPKELVKDVTKALGVHGSMKSTDEDCLLGIDLLGRRPHAAK
jgi:hypothetical protein